jgi:hypothetical protein
VLPGNKKMLDSVSIVSAFYFFRALPNTVVESGTLARRSLTPQSAGSMLEQVEARHPAASCLRHGNCLSSSRLRLLQLLSLLHAAGVFLVRRASLES